MKQALEQRASRVAFSTAMTRIKMTACSDTTNQGLPYIREKVEVALIYTRHATAM